MVLKISTKRVLRSLALYGNQGSFHTSPHRCSDKPVVETTRPTAAAVSDSRMKGRKVTVVEALTTFTCCNPGNCNQSRPYRGQRYEQRKEERLHEKQKAAVVAAAALETAKEAEETRRMTLEELRSWDAYELNIRNHARMIEQARTCVACGNWRSCEPLKPLNFIRSRPSFRNTREGTSERCRCSKPSHVRDRSGDLFLLIWAYGT